MNSNKWLKNTVIAKVQSAFLVASLAALLGLIGWLLGGNQLALMLIAGMIMLYFFSPMMSPTLLIKFNSGRQLSPEEAPHLFYLVQRLWQRAGLTRLPVLFYLPSDAMLAFTVGLRDNAAIAVSRGLMGGLSRQELTAVLAHEISHIRHDDVRTMAFASLAGQLTRILSVFGQFMLLISLPMIITGQMVLTWPTILLLIF